MVAFTSEITKHLHTMEWKTRGAYNDTRSGRGGRKILHFGTLFLVFQRFGAVMAEPQRLSLEWCKTWQKVDTPKGPETSMRSKSLYPYHSIL